MYPDPADTVDAAERLAAPRRRRRDIPFLGESVPGGAPAIETGEGHDTTAGEANHAVQQPEEKSYLKENAI